MKNILIILFSVLSFSAFAQSITNDTLPSLPYEEVYYNDFETDITGIGNFNGGSTSHDVNKLEIIGSASSKGAIFTYVNEASTDYRLEINVLDPGNGIKIYSQWGTRLTTIYTAGWHNIKFTSDASAGAFGNKVVLATTQADTVTVEFIKYSKLNARRDMMSKSEIMDSILGGAGLIYGNTFESNVNGTEMYSTADLENPVNGGYEIAVPDAGDVLCLGCNLFDDTASYRVAVNVTIYNEPLVFKAVWGSSAISPNYTASTSGWHYFDMVRRGAQASPELDGLCVHIPNAPDTIRIEEIKIEKLPNNISTDDNILIGANATRILGNGSDNTESTTTIGGNAETNLYGGVALGYSAIVGVSDYWGAVQTSGEATALGTKAKAWGWRTTAVGAEAQSAGQSSTAIGSGAEALTSHGVAIGRGSFLAPYPMNSGSVETSGVVSFEPEKLYLGNGWTHRTPEPYSDQTRGTYTPSSTEMKIFGADAYDSRFPAWDSGTTYSEDHKVFYNDSIYYSLTASNLNNIPTGDLTNWSVIHYDSQGAAADFNVSGGHLGLYSGRGTGTGEGGELRFYTAPTAGSKDGNEKNDSVLSGKFVSDDTVTDGTDLYLLDRSTDTMKRVKIKAAPASAGTKSILSFGRLYVD